jgi:GNAT superfamily N-acetyltransferase
MPDVEIIPYSPELQLYFETINKAWVNQYFSLEAFDIAQLDNPDETILAKGGAIIFARVAGEICGTVGIVPKDESTCEMIKMGVDPAAQGKGVGRALGQAVLEEAKRRGFTKMVLYSSTKLVSALALYEKLGFQKVVMECGAYGRCDIKMEKFL